MEITEQKITDLLAASQQAKKSNLTLIIDRELQWAIEPNTTYLPNQLCRVTANYSREGLRTFLEESFAAQESD